MATPATDSAQEPPPPPAPDESAVPSSQQSNNKRAPTQQSRLGVFFKAVSREEAGNNEAGPHQGAGFLDEVAAAPMQDWEVWAYQQQIMQRLEYILPLQNEAMLAMQFNYWVAMQGQMQGQ